jgi:PAS domain S-box-containing protein
MGICFHRIQQWGQHGLRLCWAVLFWVLFVGAFVHAAGPDSLPPDAADTMPWYIVYGVPIGAAVLMAAILLWNVLLRRSVMTRTFELRQELTERKKTEATLEENQRKLSLILDNLQGVVYRVLLQPKWSMEFVSEGALEQTGYTVQDLLSQRVKWDDLIVPEDRSYFRRSIEEAFQKRQTYQLEYRITTRQGRVKWVWDKGRGVFDEAGNAIAQEGFVLDISHRKDIEEKLRSREGQLASIFKASPVGMGLVSNRELLNVNERICTMTGYTRAEMLGRDVRFLYPTQEDYDYVGREKYRQIRQEGVGTTETRWRCKDGRIMDILLSSAPLDADDWSKGISFTALDITEIKTARRMAVAERDKAQQYLDIAGVMMVVLDVEGRIKLLNKRGCEILECTESRALGKDWFSAFLPESVRKNARGVFCNLITGRGDAVEYFENLILTATGQEKLIAWHNTVIRDENGEIVGTLSSGLDITEQKAAEEALQMTQFAMDHAGEAAYWMGPDAKFMYVNEAACRALKYSKDELLTMSVQDIDPDFPADIWSRHWQEVKTNKVMRFESHHKTKDGHAFPVEITSNFLEYQGDEYIWAFVRDISERKAAEKALRFTQFSVDHAGEAAFWMDSNGRLIYVNDAACTMLGFTRDELLQMSIPDLDPNFPPDKWAAYWAESKQKGSWRIETQHRAKDGRLIPVEVSINYVCYEGVEYHCSFARDISERRAAEAAQQKLMRELQAKNEELESIVFIASHDLRSPLVNIRGFTGELEKTLNRLERLLAEETLSQSARQQLEDLFKQDIAESMGFINAGNRKMDMLLNGLLRLSRVGTADVRPTELDMQQLFEGIINSFRFRIRQKDIEITIDRVVPPCRADAVLVNQIFTNLIENAIKYRSPHRPAKIHISGEAKNETVVYCVRDNGIGIAPEHVDKVFEIFHRLNPESDQDGEGLGLTIVRRVLKRQDGQIWIESEPNTGTSVFVELPGI